MAPPVAPTPAPSTNWEDTIKETNVNGTANMCGVMEISPENRLREVLQQDAHAILRFCSQGMEHARDPGRSCLHRGSVLLCEAKATGDVGVHPGLCGIGRTYTTYNTRQNVCLAGGVCAAHSTAGNSFSICEVYRTMG